MPRCTFYLKPRRKSSALALTSARSFLIILALFLPICVHAEVKKPQKKAPPKVYHYSDQVPTPTRSAVKYGSHERHILDFWKAESDSPTPVAFVIHGGGWNNGSKEKLESFVNPKRLLESGVSIVAINYRLMRHVGDASPPVKVPLRDAALALQFVKSKAAEWGIDKNRIGATGGSAGACSSLWILYHDDLADPEHSNPVLRESSRLKCAAVHGAQTTLDPKQVKDWTPNARYGGHAFSQKNMQVFLKNRDSLLELINEYSPYHQLTKDDPPVSLYYGDKPEKGAEKKDPTHSANYGAILKEGCEKLGLQCELNTGLKRTERIEQATQYLIQNL